MIDFILVTFGTIILHFILKLEIETLTPTPINVLRIYFES